MCDSLSIQKVWEGNVLCNGVLKMSIKSVITYGLLTVSESFELNGNAKIQVSSNRMRTFQQIQDFAAEIFNRDEQIQKTYTGDSWTKSSFQSVSFL